LHTLRDQDHGLTGLSISDSGLWPRTAPLCPSRPSELHHGGCLGLGGPFWEHLGRRLPRDGKFVAIGPLRQRQIEEGLGLLQRLQPLNPPPNSRRFRRTRPRGFNRATFADGNLGGGSGVWRGFVRGQQVSHRTQRLRRRLESFNLQRQFRQLHALIAQDQVDFVHERPPRVSFADASRDTSRLLHLARQCGQVAPKIQRRLHTAPRNPGSCLRTSKLAL